MSYKKVTKIEALNAIRTLLLWIGENPEREGLIETPERIIKSYAEKFSGYHKDPADILAKQFSETSGYSGIIILSDINVESHCEHHFAPIIGKAHIGYLPQNRVVGISKLARLVEMFAKRLQLQERLTAQIANAIVTYLDPKGVVVMIEAKHHCICHRGIQHRDTMMVTSCFLGEFESNNTLQQQFLMQVRKS